MHLKERLRSLFSLILTGLESGEEPFHYEASHRKILIAVSFLFTVLATVVVLLMPGTDSGHWIPVVIFGTIAFVGFVVGFLGNDRAVAKIWGSRK